MVSSSAAHCSRPLISSLGTKRTGFPTNQHFVASVTYLGLGKARKEYFRNGIDEQSGKVKQANYI